MVMDGNALDRQFWAAREASLVAVDRHVGLVFASLLVAAATYNVSVIAKLHQQQALAIDRDRSVQAMLGLMALHVLLELVLCGIIARTPRHYASHRSATIIAARSAALALMLAYIPRTWPYTVHLEMAAGKAPALAARLLVAGCMSASGVLETLCFRLRLRTALPYHTLRWLASMAPLPRLLTIFGTHAPLRAVAESVWRSVTAAYGSAAALALGLDLPRSLTTSASPCTVLVLVLWLHASLALVVPLYLLALLEARSKAAFVAGLHGGREQSVSSGSAHGGSVHGGSVHGGSVHGGSVHGGSMHGGSAASSSTVGSGASSIGTAPLLLGTNSGSLASPTSGASDVTGVSASGSRVAALAAAAHGTPGEPPALSLGRLLPVNSLALHCVILFCITMAVWAVCDAAVVLWLHKPAARFGMCV